MGISFQNAAFRLLSGRQCKTPSRPKPKSEITLQRSWFCIFRNLSKNLPRILWSPLLSDQCGHL